MARVSELEIKISVDDREVAGGLARTESALQGTVQRSTGIMSSMGQMIQRGFLMSIGWQLAHMATSIIQLPADIVKIGMAFENAMVNANSLMRVSNEELSRISDQVRNLGAQTMFGPTQAANAFYEIVQAVPEAIDDSALALEMLNQAMRTAEAGQADLIQTTSAMIGIGNSYQLKVADMARVSDVLSAAVGVGADSMNNFAGAFGKVSGTAARMNVGLEEVGAVMSYITTRGFSAAQASTQVNRAMMSLLKPNEKLNKLLQEMGQASGSAMLQQYGLVESLKMLYEATGYSEDAMAQLLGRQEAFKGFLAVTDTGFTRFMEIYNELLPNATEKMLEKQMDSLTIQWRHFKSELESTAIVIYDKLRPALEGLISIGSGALAGLSGLLGINVTPQVNDFAAEAVARVEEAKNRAQRDIAAKLVELSVNASIRVDLPPNTSLYAYWQQNLRDRGIDWGQLLAAANDFIAATPGVDWSNYTENGLVFQMSAEGRIAPTITIDEAQAGIERISNMPDIIKNIYFVFNPEVAKVIKQYEEIGAISNELTQQIQEDTQSQTESVDRFFEEVLKKAWEVFTWPIRQIVHVFKQLLAGVLLTFNQFVDNLRSSLNQIIDFFWEGRFENVVMDAFRSHRYSDIGVFIVDAVADGIDNSKVAFHRAVQDLVDEVVVSIRNSKVAFLQAVQDLVAGIPEVRILGETIIPDLSRMIQGEIDKIALPVVEVEVQFSPVDQGLGWVYAGDIQWEFVPTLDEAGMADIIRVLMDIEKDRSIQIVVGDKSFASTAEYLQYWYTARDEIETPISPSFSAESTAAIMGTLGEINDEYLRLEEPRTATVDVTGNIIETMDWWQRVQDKVVNLTVRAAASFAGFGGPGAPLTVEARALGGPVLSGQTYLVGEKGPELFTPQQSGYIVPNRDLYSLSEGGAGRGGGIVINTLNLYGVQNAQQLLEELGRLNKRRAVPVL